MLTATDQTLCRQFAELLSYPSAELPTTLSACTALLQQKSPAAVDALQRFADFVQTHTTAQVEELFTATFDLQPACHPYVGYQLCGESQQRGMFLMQLNQIYRRHGFVAGVELPDHLCTLLRFIGTKSPPDCSLELIEDGLLPVLTKILQGLEEGNHPYVELLQSLQRFLVATVDGVTELPAVGRQKESCS
ncbi:MAG: nitrate reductase molybdenum cofactor assembly chaperone [Desulfuromonadaceae bacterium]|nr:nitrate reductase molybdenum cofactor assembly chaperone [Desulfuromonadaceae bacterium]